MAEEACQFFAESHQINVTVLRLFNVYGPEQSTILLSTIINQIESDGIIKVEDLERQKGTSYTLRMYIKSNYQIYKI